MSDKVKDLLELLGGERTSRPAERMEPFLKQLMAFWLRRPDWRFGQMMCNLDRAYRMAHDGADFFYLEEDEFLAFLEEYEAERR